MSLKERDLRSRLAQLISSQGLLHGTIDERARTCGKQNCKCFRGEKHVSLYLVFREDGKLRHLYVPDSHADQVRAWVENYQRLLALVEEISTIHRQKVQNREK
ncbi:MAG: DUF6788 family protein [Rhabdochlamydiaceae bacterium]